MKKVLLASAIGLFATTAIAEVPAAAPAAHAHAATAPAHATAAPAAAAPMAEKAADAANATGSTKATVPAKAHGGHKGHHHHHGGGKHAKDNASTEMLNKQMGPWMMPMAAPAAEAMAPKADMSAGPMAAPAAN